MNTFAAIQKEVDGSLNIGPSVQLLHRISVHFIDRNLAMGELTLATLKGAKELLEFMKTLIVPITHFGLE